MGAKKYIFVTGGVLSGVGKGITAASVGAVLQAKGLAVSIQKCDPYLNADAGLLNPAEHGECFVTHDGAETDLDLGHYERFLDIELTRRNSTLSGRLLLELIEKERSGGFHGKTVQLVPHLTAAIQDEIVAAGEGSDIHIVEIGGTVGDYEGLSYVEAIREFSWRVGRENCLFIHVVYVPFIGTSKEFKTKPAQNALNDLRGFGIVPDAVIVRTDDPAPKSVAQKIALFGGVPERQVQLMPNVDTVFRMPSILAGNGMHELLSKFSGVMEAPDLSKWDEIIVRQNRTPSQSATIGIVAKYLDNEDTYLSVVEALKAASWQEGIGVQIRWINAEDVASEDLTGLDAIMVPGGFGERGIEGKVTAARYALEHKIPYLGISLGLQVAAIAAARISGLEAAHSTETNPEHDQAVVHSIDVLQAAESPRRGLRLGAHTVVMKEASRVAELYEANEVAERHRHQYQVNQVYLDSIKKGGLVASAYSSDGAIVECLEGSDHPYFVATQFHPEFRSRPFRPHPLFRGLLRATVKTIA